MTNRRENTLLDLGESNCEAPWLQKNYDEGLSICDHLEQPDEGEDREFFKTTKKIIFWTPSEILSNLNAE